MVIVTETMSDIADIVRRDLLPSHRQQLISQWRRIEYVESEKHCFETVFKCWAQYPPTNLVTHRFHFILPYESVSAGIAEDEQKRLEGYLAEIKKKLPFAEPYVTIGKYKKWYANKCILNSIQDLKRLILDGFIAETAELDITDVNACTLRLHDSAYILFRSKYELNFEIKELPTILNYIADSTVGVLSINTSHWSSDVIGEFLRKARNLHSIEVYPRWSVDHPSKIIVSTDDIVYHANRLCESLLPINLTLQRMEDGCMSECVLNTVFQNRLVTSFVNEDTFTWYPIISKHNDWCSGLDSVTIGIDDMTQEMVESMKSLGNLPIKELSITYYGFKTRDLEDRPIADIYTYGIHHVLNNPHIRAISIDFNECAESHVINHVIRHLNETRRATSLVSLDLTLGYDSTSPFDALWARNFGAAPRALSTFCELVRNSNLEEIRVRGASATSDHELFNSPDIFSDMLREHKTLRRIGCEVCFSTDSLRRIVKAFSSNPNILELDIELESHQYKDDVCSDLIIAHISHWKNHCSAYQQSVHLGMCMISRRSGMRNTYDPRLSVLVMSYTREHYYI